MDKLSAVDTIRGVILANPDRSVQYDEIAGCLGVTRHQAKMLYFSWMYRATEEYLQGMIAGFDTVNKASK